MLQTIIGVTQLLTVKLAIFKLTDVNTKPSLRILSFMPYLLL